MTRSAVRSRLAPPRSALRATRGAAAQSPKGEAWCPAKPAGRRRAATDSLPRKPWRPLLDETRYALAEIAAAQRHHHFAVGVDGRFRERLERHVVELPLDHGHRARRDEIGKIARIGVSFVAQLVRRIEPVD